MLYRSRGHTRVAALSLSFALILAACAGTDETVTESSVATEPGDSVTTSEAAPPESQDAGRLVVANWGGGDGDARVQVAHPLVEEQLGIAIVDVPGPVDYGKIRVMVDAGRPEWDFAITAISAFFTLGEDYFEPIDYDSNPELWENVINTHPYAAPEHVSCETIVYRTDAFPEGEGPDSWADFWDTDAFPGRRSLGADGGVPWFTMENALLAAGVEPSDVYPIDYDLAFQSLDELRATGQLDIWDSYAEGAQQLATGQVVMARMHVPTLWDLILDGTLSVSWDGAVCWTESIHIVKGTADYEAAMDYIEILLDPEVQAELVQISKSGPVNRDALEFVPEEIRDLLPVPEAYVDSVVWQDYQWYGDNYEDLGSRWNIWQLEG